ncbi:MAG: hypothetical protein O2894_06405 [Planctomycetota bacterium]|nr:hypothetical protein [Planctomycetota bacterium]
MRTLLNFTSRLSLLALFALAAPTAHACGDYMSDEMREMVAFALSDDERDVADAIDVLRESGAESVYALFGALQGAKTPEEVAHVRSILDRVAAQKDAHASRLFWHTDLERAKADAAQTNRPILSLRLLGRLDEDLSCANSRYFRTVLYADPSVANVLRTHFVLHWQSVRPVPVITIDFGDGRTLCRTVTGNSIHYVLHPDGRPVDALPGLLSAPVFTAALERARMLEADVRLLPEAGREERLNTWHGAQAARLAAEHNADRSAAGVAPAAGTIRLTLAPTVAVAEAAPEPARAPAPEAPSARAAAMVTHGKFISESSMLRAVQPAVSDEPLAADAAAWGQIARLDRHAAGLSEGSLTLMRTKAPTLDPAAFARMAETFTHSVAVDSVRNEQDIHRRLHAWFAAGRVSTLADLNERIYAELFLTPSSDPWLGLAPSDAYVALDGGGLR